MSGVVTVEVSVMNSERSGISPIVPSGFPSLYTPVSRLKYLASGTAVFSLSRSLISCVVFRYVCTCAKELLVKVTKKTIASILHVCTRVFLLCFFISF